MEKHIDQEVLPHAGLHPFLYTYAFERMLTSESYGINRVKEMKADEFTKILIEIVEKTTRDLKIAGNRNLDEKSLDKFSKQELEKMYKVHFQPKEKTVLYVSPIGGLIVIKQEQIHCSFVGRKTNMTYKLVLSNMLVYESNCRDLAQIPFDSQTAQNVVEDWCKELNINPLEFFDQGGSGEEFNRRAYNALDRLFQKTARRDEILFYKLWTHLIQLDRKEQCEKAGCEYDWVPEGQDINAEYTEFMRAYTKIAVAWVTELAQAKADNRDEKYVKNFVSFLEHLSMVWAKEWTADIMPKIQLENEDTEEALRAFKKVIEANTKRAYGSARDGYQERIAKIKKALDTYWVLFLHFNTK